MKSIGRVYIGVDPGQSGGIAMLRDDGSILSAVAMPDTESDILEALKDWNRYGLNAKAVLERVWSSPGWGHAGAFKFGLNYGSLRMALMAAQIPHEEVLPARWQTAMNCRSGKDKNVTKRRAQGLWPRYTITHALADALLIAEHCRRTDRGLSHGNKSAGQGEVEGRRVRPEEVAESIVKGFEGVGRRIRDQARKFADDYPQGAAKPDAAGHGTGSKRPA